ncbi:hypothetical protein K466DRAFT_392372 [Polyporus arcularius HHB13444]|uniref:Uncharacterized protein n=1 Tax=Polyporus arcularius HHB13444 TaxID=1314778 RepID=A0A5C3P326_9APHY|nr:hypothetical protein K466DRAFT_392372 [Polyporus arcularius HHB13444]
MAARRRRRTTTRKTSILLRWYAYGRPGAEPRLGKTQPTLRGSRSMVLQYYYTVCVRQLLPSEWGDNTQMS